MKLGLSKATKGDNTYSHDLMEAGVSDVGISFPVNGQAMRHVEHVTAKPGNYVTSVGIQNQNRILFNHVPFG